MQPPVPTTLLWTATLLLNRLSLGLMFSLAGLYKMVQTGLGDFYTHFRHIKPEWVPMIYGYLLPFVEVVAGLALVIGFLGRTASILITLMLLSFMIGCGIQFWPMEEPPFDSNTVLFTLALWLTLTGPGRWSMDTYLHRRRTRSRDPIYDGHDKDPAGANDVAPS